MGSATPPILRGSSLRITIFAFPSIYVYTLRRRTTKLGVVTYVGDGLGFYEVSHVLHLKEAWRQQTEQTSILGIPQLMRRLHMV